MLFRSGITVVTATGHVNYGSYSQDSKRQWWPLPNIYYTQQINDRWWLGLGAMARFGLSNDYADESWMSPSASLYHVGVTTFSVQPTVAFKATDRLSVSLGAEVQYLNFTEKINFGLSKVDLDGDSYALSGIASVFYKANEKVNAGISFRMRNEHSVRGPAKYTPADGIAFINGGDFWGDITFPAQLALGVSYRPIEKLLIEANFTNVFWSCFRAVDIYYDHLPRTGASGLLGTHAGNSKHYQDAYRVGVGVEYTLTDAIKLRGSFVFDKSPLNEEFMDVMLPVDDRYIIGTGAGFKLSENTILDLSYNILFATHLDGVAADHTTPVHYSNSTSHLMGLSFRYKF